MRLNGMSGKVTALLSSLLFLFLPLSPLVQGDGMSSVLWSRPHRVTTDSAWDCTPAAFQDTNGWYWMFWASNREGEWSIYYKTSPSGMDWSEPVRLSEGAGSWRPSAFQDSSGRYWVFWGMEANGNWDVYYRVLDGSCDWSDPTKVTTDPAVDETPSAFQDSSGRYWVFWTSTRDGVQEVYYRVLDGEVWSDPIRLTEKDTYIDWRPSAFQDSFGKYWVFWESGRDGDWNVYYKVRTDGEWSPPNRVPTSGASDEYPHAFQDNDDCYWLFWSVGGSTHRLYCMNRVKRWLCGVDLTPGNTPSAFQDSSGRYWVFWSADSPGGNPDIYYMIGLVI